MEKNTPLKKSLKLNLSLLEEIISSVGFENQLEFSDCKLHYLKCPTTGMPVVSIYYLPNFKCV
jgi:hypothetical protein